MVKNGCMTSALNAQTLFRGGAIPVLTLGEIRHMAREKGEVKRDHWVWLMQKNNLSQATLARKLHEAGVKDGSGKELSENQILSRLKQYSRPNATITPYWFMARTEEIEGLSISQGFFSCPPPQNTYTNVGHSEDVLNSTESDNLGESPGTIQASGNARTVSVPLRTLGSRGCLLAKDGEVVLTRIEVPRWFAEENVDALRVDCDDYLPYLRRNDVLLLKKDPYRKDALAVTNKGDQVRVCVIRDEGAGTIFEPVSSTLADLDGDRENMGVVVGILLNYIEGQTLPMSVIYGGGVTLEMINRKTG